MSNRQQHPEWPTLTTDTLENPKRAGRNWVCTCPVCHTHHLNVDRRTGLFKCWYIGCEFRGILADKRLPQEGSRPSAAAGGRYSHWSPDRNSYRTSGRNGYGKTAANPFPLSTPPTRQVRMDDGSLWTCGGYDESEDATWQLLDTES